jgi:hypothetical protein
VQARRLDRTLASLVAHQLPDLDPEVRFAITTHIVMSAVMTLAVKLVMAVNVRAPLLVVEMIVPLLPQLAIVTMVVMILTQK